MMTKAQTRQLARRRVEEMRFEERAAASERIFRALVSLDEFADAKSAFVFLNTQIEPSTKKIIATAIELGKIVCVPKIVEHEMKAIRVLPDTEFFVDDYGIEEPVEGEICASHDIAILPVVAFCGLERLGHGGGFYDRYLANVDTFKIGLAFDCQQVDELETRAHDIPLDMMITQKRIITKNRVYPNEIEG